MGSGSSVRESHGRRREIGGVAGNTLGAANVIHEAVPLTPSSARVDPQLQVFTAAACRAGCDRRADLSAIEEQAEVCAASGVRPVKPDARADASARGAAEQRAAGVAAKSLQRTGPIHEDGRTAIRPATGTAGHQDAQT